MWYEVYVTKVMTGSVSVEADSMDEARREVLAGDYDNDIDWDFEPAADIKDPFTIHDITPCDFIP